MGGLFVRKVAGAASLGVQIMKALPLLIHPSTNTRWKHGHFKPLMYTAIVANTILFGFYASYLPDLANAGADVSVQRFMVVVGFETLAILWYLFQLTKQQRSKPTKTIAVAMKNGKTPTAVVSRIVLRTMMIISTAITVIAGRDLFFPGFILPKYVMPKDEIYLEWTGALIHSPPEGSPEAEEQGLESSLYVGEKFVHQLMAVNLLILCLYKFVSSFWIKYGTDGSGEIKSKMIWKSQFVSNALLVFIIRLFASAAKSASLDLRWHLMALAYETFILGTFYVNG